MTKKFLRLCEKGGQQIWVDTETIMSISSSLLEGYSLVRLAPDGFVLTIAETPDDIIQKLTSICEEGENRGG